MDCLWKNARDFIDYEGSIYPHLIVWKNPTLAKDKKRFYDITLPLSENPHRLLYWFEFAEEGDYIFYNERTKMVYYRRGNEVLRVWERGYALSQVKRVRLLTYYLIEKDGEAIPIPILNMLIDLFNGELDIDNINKEFRVIQKEHKIMINTYYLEDGGFVEW